MNHAPDVLGSLSACEHPKTGVTSALMESIYEFVMVRLEKAKGGWPAVAKGSGVSLRTIEKIARKEIKDPGVSHIEKIAGYFREQSKSPTRTQHA